MTRRQNPPCNHHKADVGTVWAGDPKSGPFCSVSTCAACVEQSRGFVQIVTGLPPSDLLTYAEYRAQKAGLA